MGARITATAVPIAIAVVGVWLGGYDFDKRGGVSAWVFVICSSYACWQWFAPWWRKD